MKIFNLPDQQFRVALDVGAITFDFCSLFNFRMSSMYLSGQVLLRARYCLPQTRDIPKKMRTLMVFFLNYILRYCQWKKKKKFSIF